MNKSDEKKIIVKISKELNKPNPNINNIIDIFKEQEVISNKECDKLRKVRSYEIKTINNGLRQCIEAHGPITKEFIGSASKRILGACIQGQKLREFKEKKISIRDILIGSLITVIFFIIFT